MGWMGGRARAKALSARRRREIAIQANRARWASRTPGQRKAETAAARASSIRARKVKARKKRTGGR